MESPELYLLNDHLLYLFRNNWYDATTLRSLSSPSGVARQVWRIPDYRLESTPLFIQTRNSYYIYTTVGNRLVLVSRDIFGPGDFDAGDIIRIQLFKVPNEELPPFNPRWYQIFRNNIGQDIDEVILRGNQTLTQASSRENVERITVTENNIEQLQSNLREGQIVAVIPSWGISRGRRLHRFDRERYVLYIGDIVERIRPMVPETPAEIPRLSSEFIASYIHLLHQLYKL